MPALLSDQLFGVMIDKGALSHDGNDEMRCLNVAFPNGYGAFIMTLGEDKVYIANFYEKKPTEDGWELVPQESNPESRTPVLAEKVIEAIERFAGLPDSPHKDLEITKTGFDADTLKERMLTNEGTLSLEEFRIALEHSARPTHSFVAGSPPTGFGPN